jgi:hypothetical protein
LHFGAAIPIPFIIRSTVILLRSLLSYVKPIEKEEGRFVPSANKNINSVNCWFLISLATMKSINIYFLFAALILISSCKKNTSGIVPEKALIYRDSVSFFINGKNHISNQKNLAGIGNRQINIKPYATLLSNQDWEYNTGGYYWYGEKDSTLYDTFYGFTSEKDYTAIKISFSKKYHNNQLKKSPTMLVPADNSSIFKVGPQSFAVDLNLENTMDGISVVVRDQDLREELSSYIPGFSVVIRTSLTKDIQDNSTFEITKVQKLDDKLYLVEAEFAVNLFDKNGKLYRLEKGFLRLKTSMKVFNGFL